MRARAIGLTALIALSLVALGCDMELLDDDDYEVPMDDLVIEDLGTFTATDQGEVFMDLAVPAGAVSSTVIMEGGGDDLLTHYSVRDPDYATIYSYDDPYGYNVRCFPTDDVHTFMHPTSPKEDIRAGTYGLEPFTDASSVDAAVTAIHKTVARSGDVSVALTFHIVGVPGLDAAGAEDHAELAEAINEMDAILSGAGVLVADIAYADVTDSVDELTIIESDGGPSSELGRLLAMSGDGVDRRLHLFLVQGIDYGGMEVVGQAGSSPGPIVAGTSHSGIAVSTVDLDGAPAVMGLATAHEIGHYLGLFHTTEKDGYGWDPLDDTPYCGPENDTNGDTFVDAGECAGLDAANVMFWSPDAGTTAMTADQEWVMARGPMTFQD